jgi:hypothetical protein
MPSRDGLAPSRIASLKFEGWRNPGAALQGRCGCRSMRFKRAGQARGGRKGGSPAQDDGAVLSSGGRRESLKMTGVTIGDAMACEAKWQRQ